MEEHPKLHPLLIDHVIENILNNGDFSKSDLLNFRLVCQDWKIAVNNKLKLFLDLDKRSDIDRIEKLLRLLRNRQETMPEIREMKLVRDLIPKGRKASQFQDTLGKLLRFVSNQVQTLSLSMDDTTDLRFRDRHYSKMRTFTNLQVLQLTKYGGPKPNNLDVDRVGLDSHFFLNLSEKLLKKTPPGLERLKIRWYQWYPASTHRNGSNFRDKILRNIPASVKDLKLMIFEDLTVQVATGISSLLLPNLTRLSLDFRFFREIDLDFSVILHNFKVTLQKLSLTLEPKRTINLRLPVFPNLTSLKLWLWNVAPAINADLEFGSKFPKVREISMSSRRRPQSADIMDALFPTGFDASEVTSFTWGCYLRLRSTQVANLMQGFGNLRKLIIEDFRLVNNNLNVVFQHCGHLEELTIYLGLWDLTMMIPGQLDIIFTGIPYAYYLRNLPDWKSFELATIKTGPGLSDLRNLKVLKILGHNISLPGQGTLKITDVTGHFGFLQLPKLEKLVTDEFHMSKEFIAELKARFGEDSISTYESYWYIQVQPNQHQ